MKKKDSNTKKAVLAGHKKVGNTFIPPFSQIGKFSEISYINVVLPEIIWMGLVRDKYGVRESVDLCAEFAKTARSVCSNPNKVNFALASSFKELSGEEKTLLLAALRAKNILALIQECLLPLVELYGEFPVSFIGKPHEIPERPALIKRMRECVRNHFNKYEHAAMVIQSNVVYIRAITGGLHFANNVEPPDLEAIIKSPDSETAHRSSGMVRSMVLQEFIPRGETTSYEWSKSFWNKNYPLDRCFFYEKETE